jgi:hypothetical protein
MGEFHQAGEGRHALAERCRLGRRAQFGFVAPKLLGEVEAYEIRELLIETLIFRVVSVVGEVVVAAAGRLHRKPYPILCTHATPTADKLNAVRRNGKLTRRRAVARRQRQVEHTPRTHILRHQVDDLLRIGIVPAVDVHQPHRVRIVHRTAHGCDPVSLLMCRHGTEGSCCRYRQADGKQDSLYTLRDFHCAVLLLNCY